MLTKREREREREISAGQEWEEELRRGGWGVGPSLYDGNLTPLAS